MKEEKRMSRDLQLVQANVDPNRCIASAAGVGVALAVTDDELIIASSGFLGLWGKRVQRYKLDRLTYVGHTPNSYGHALCLMFDDSPDGRMTIRFEPWAKEAFAPIIEALRARVPQQHEQPQDVRR
jgi:hypothetical protein